MVTTRGIAVAGNMQDTIAPAVQIRLFLYHNIEHTPNKEGVESAD